MNCNMQYTNLPPDPQIIINSEPEEREMPREAGHDWYKEKRDVSKTKKNTKTLTPHRLTKPFRPIILCFVLYLCFSWISLGAQIQGSVALGAQYTDNVFALSDYDFERFNDNHASFDFVETTDDLSLISTIDLKYPLRYRWWKLEPSITATISDNISINDKYRRDFAANLRVERYHWNATLQYGFNPRIYIRDYVDSDGTGKLEPYSYQRNTYRSDANLRITRDSTIRLHARYEELYYNEFWTQYDGNALTYGIGFRHSFPLFVINGMYYFRSFDCDYDAASAYNDASYESDRYTFGFALKPIPLNDAKKNGAAYKPSLSLSYEERFYQGLDSWYGGRIDKMYNTTAGIELIFSPQWNLSLDYSHVFRNVESPNQSVLQLKEYAENRVGATLNYNF